METAANRVLVIEAGKAGKRYWQDIWLFRDLVITMAWRDIAVRYKQAALGVAWSVVRPVTDAMASLFVFRVIANAQGLPGVPYLLMAYVGSLAWGFFSTGLGDCSSSLVSAGAMISKVYFPRLVVPISKVAVSFVDMLISLGVYILLVLYFVLFNHGPDHIILPGWHILFLPVFVALTWLAAMAFGLWLAALNVKYRDVQYIVPFFIRIGFFVSPVGWWSGSDKISPKLKMLVALNPMAPIIEGYRWCLFNTPLAQPDLASLAISVLVIALFLFGGLQYFRSTERLMADHI